ncbi:MAG: hypothetical protein AAF438_04480, partial [Pseudomonadota bacterium]
VVLPDQDGNGVDEVGLRTENFSSGTQLIQVRDPVSGSVIRNIQERGVTSFPEAIQFGTLQEDVPNLSLIKRSDDSLIVGGGTKGSLTALPNLVETEPWIKKISPSGNTVWTLQPKGTFEEAIRNLLPIPQSTDFFAVDLAATIYRISDSGEILWRGATDFESSQTDVLVGNYWATTDANGDLFSVSWTSPGGVGLSSRITKFSGSTGQELWRRDLALDTEDTSQSWIPGTLNRIQIRNLVVAANGNLIVVGSFNNGFDIQRPCTTCGFAAAFSADGLDLWQRAPLTPTNACGSSNTAWYRLVEAIDGTYYVVGDNQVFDPNDQEPDGLFARFNQDFTAEIWSDCDETGGDVSFNFTPPIIKGDGSLVTFGSVGDNAVVFTHSVGGALVSREVISANRADGTPGRITAGGIAERNNGELVLTGSVEGEAGESPENGDLDVYILRRDSSGAPLD